MRYFIELAYNGKAYFGWQNQPALVTIQQTLEKALFTYLQVSTPVVGAGRTDAGVHASKYYAHFDAVTIEDMENFVYRINAILPDDIAVYDVFGVHPQAHARFDALSRSYQYTLIQQKDPFLKDVAYYVKSELDIKAMNQAAVLLKDYSDFKCFSKSRTDVKTYNCKITEAYWEQKKKKLIFHITADRFLRNMVRAVVGTLLEVGLGKLALEELPAIINSRDRQNAGTSVPAKGLFLTDIVYPKTIVKR